MDIRKIVKNLLYDFLSRLRKENSNSSVDFYRYIEKFPNEITTFNDSLCFITWYKQEAWSFLEETRLKGDKNSNHPFRDVKGILLDKTIFMNLMEERVVPFMEKFFDTLLTYYLVRGSYNNLGPLTEYELIKMIRDKAFGSSLMIQ